VNRNLHIFNATFKKRIFADLQLGCARPKYCCILTKMRQYNPHMMDHHWPVGES